ncbi:hypothetical protein A3D03_03820 [Candidatus Gottesmanbacteria bacterium RIFCSPHIGHO2_02_FULL_40_13]|uniref:SpoVT-AbrB domain-containing protein n=1 Tax=Candidatus Gottesmanbacteria bacterium RIFCSPHIGHO2_02_FULL_40_13 TaxID=1798384 RepID=A0A1F6ADF6_9BACT|nr:MAG: hypothetical protein A3D03_03820 [Candidatus Gottesmanbacteria bacterium RIFCSPHIGHO2_02_FULL_40_13]
MNTSNPYIGEITIGERYQAVIPKKVREIARKMKAGVKATVVAIDERTVIVTVKPKDWVKETYGMHKKIWQGIDATEYIQTLRSEWVQNRHQ